MKIKICYGNHVLMGINIKKTGNDTHKKKAKVKHLDILQ